MKNNLMFNLKITKMKKLFSLVSLLVLIGMSVNVMGQSTGTAPFPGAKHLYSVDGGGTSTQYVWTVLDNALATSTDGVISASGALPLTSAEVNVTWGAGLTVGDVYYVRVVKTVAGCSNTKMLKVTITASNFSLALTTSDGCYTNPVTISAPGEVETYTHGSATVSYTVTPTGLSLTQGYTFTFTPPAPVGYTPVLQSLASGVTQSSNDYTVTTGVAATITYIITKDADTTNADAAGTAANFAAPASISNGVSSLGVVGLATGAKSATSNVSRPDLTNITTGAN